MDKLFTKTGKLLNSSAILLVHKDLTQNLVGKENIVLWNNQPSEIDFSTLIEFKDALKKTTSRYYMFNHILSYSDFCISLICCLEYSLNHKVTVSIPERAFTAAWRAIEVISDTSTDSVRFWLKPFVDGRTAVGYCNALNTNLDNITTFTSSTPTNTTNYNQNDLNVLSDLSISENIVEIPHFVNEADTGHISYSTRTPEGQLYDLTMAHYRFNNRFI